MEYSTAVAETGRNKLGFEVPTVLPTGTTISPKLTIERETNIAQIYTVSETLQLGHAALYRLCEARGNGDIEKADDYKQMFTDVFTKVQDLIQVQVDVRHHQIVAERVRVADELEAIDRDLRTLNDDAERLLSATQCASAVNVPEVQSIARQLPPYPSPRSAPILDALNKALITVDAAKFPKGTAAADVVKQECLASIKVAGEALHKLVTKQSERESHENKLRGIDSALKYLLLANAPKTAAAQQPSAVPAQVATAPTATAKDTPPAEPATDAPPAATSRPSGP